jgi:hypothetical protein
MPESSGERSDKNNHSSIIKFLVGGSLVTLLTALGSLYFQLCKAGNIEKYCLSDCNVQARKIFVITEKDGALPFELISKENKKVTDKIYLRPNMNATFEVGGVGTFPNAKAEYDFLWSISMNQGLWPSNPVYSQIQRSNSFAYKFENVGIYSIDVEILSGSCKEEIIQIPVYVTPAIISQPATRVIINPEQESIQSENYPSSSQSEDLFNLARSEAEISDVKIEITSPVNGSIVAQSSPVTGSIYGLNWPLRAFLVVSEISASSGKGLWWTTEISPDSNFWSAPSAQFGDERPDGGTARFEVFVVLTKDPATIDALKFRYYALENLQEKHRDELDLEVRGPVITVSRQ